MKNVLSRLWADDRGAVISTELVLVIGILIFGIIPGLVALRNSVNAALGTIGNILTSVVPSFTFSGFAIGAASPPGGRTIAQVQGFQVDASASTLLTSVQSAPIVISTQVAVAPAP